MTSDRDLFEAAYRADYPMACALSPKKFNRDGDNYEDMRVQIGWRMWQAARRAQHSTAAEPVAWAATDETGRKVEALGFTESRRFDTPLYLGAAPQQTPLSLPAMPDLRYHAEYRRGFADCLSDVQRELNARGISAAKETR